MCYSVMVEQDIKKLGRGFGAHIDEEAFSAYQARLLSQPKLKAMDRHARIYPNYWAPVLAKAKTLQIFPMRYRMRPSWSLAAEVPSKYNLFNARLDSLTTRRSWQGVFMKNHGFIVIKCFYEWVERGGKKQVIAFSSRETEALCVPVIWDHFQPEKAQQSLRSFALITTAATPEIAAAGHDRCPIHLDREALDIWLNPGRYSPSSMLALLQNQRRHSFTNVAATP